MEYTKDSVPDGRHGIEVPTMADSSLRSEDIVGCIRAHVPANILVRFWSASCNYISQARARNKEDCFQIPEFSIGFVQLKLLGEQGGSREIGGLLWPCYHPPLIAHLSINICTEPIAISMPQMEGPRSSGKAPSAAHGRE